MTLLLRRDVPLAPYTTYQIGGPADELVEAQSRDELVLAVREAREAGLPFFLLGMGANVLIGDGGVRGRVILNRANRASCEGNRLRAESGAVMADLIELAASAGLSGLEHFAGIPSSVGGALWQNLHFLSPDRQRTVFIAEILVEAEVLDEGGTVRTVGPEFFQFGYDQSVLRQNRELVALGATVALQLKPETEIRQQIEENLAWRRARQPQLPEFPSCGSVFKRIEGVGAGRLIDQVGLKGYRIGGAQISEQHANFIVNRGGATAADVRALIALAQEKVLAGTGYRLEPEINFVGEE